MNNTIYSSQSEASILVLIWVLYFTLHTTHDKKTEDLSYISFKNLFSRGTVLRYELVELKKNEKNINVVLNFDFKIWILISCIRISPDPRTLVLSAILFHLFWCQSLSTLLTSAN